MAEEKLIQLDSKILSLGVADVKKFALHLKIEEKIGEGNKKLAMIKEIRLALENNLEILTDDEERIGYLEGLIDFLSKITPTENVNRDTSEQSNKEKEILELQKQMDDLLAKQTQIKSQLATTESESIQLPTVSIKKSILHRDFKIQGQVGDAAQKDKLGYQSLISQIEAGLSKGYSEREVVDAVIRAIQPGTQLRSYLEGMVGLTLPKLRKILRFHFHEKSATELYQELANMAQLPKEDPQSFLLRALTTRQKIILTSKEAGNGIVYSIPTVQSLFLHALETGLQEETIRAKIRPIIKDPSVTDEQLIETISMAMSAEAERQNKFDFAGKSKAAKVASVESTKSEKAGQEQILAAINVLKADLAAMQTEMTTLRKNADSYKSSFTNPSRQSKHQEPGCSDCKGKGVGKECPHCFYCGGLNHIARHCQLKGKNNQMGNGQRLPPRDRE